MSATIQLLLLFVFVQTLPLRHPSKPAGPALLSQFAKRKYIAAMIRRNATRLPANGNITSIAILHLSRKSMSLMPRSPFASL
jgi:hypothetical protein